MVYWAILVTCEKKRHNEWNKNRNAIVFLIPQNKRSLHPSKIKPIKLSTPIKQQFTGLFRPKPSLFVYNRSTTRTTPSPSGPRATTRCATFTCSTGSTDHTPSVLKHASVVDLHTGPGLHGDLRTFPKKKLQHFKKTQQLLNTTTTQQQQQLYQH